MDDQLPPQIFHNNTPIPIENSKPKRILFIIIFVVIFIIVVILGFYIYKTKFLTNNSNIEDTQAPSNIIVSTPSPVPTIDQTTEWKIFSHPTYKYQFKYPPYWSAVINKNVSSETLFGLYANSESGIGGVEVREIPTEPQDFYLLTGSKIIEQSFLIINGISGYKTKYSNIINGTNFVFRYKDGLLYNIYINSDDSEDLKIFEGILSSFKFTD